jgi:hypothetical protein
MAQATVATMSHPAPVLPEGLHYAKLAPTASLYHVANAAGRRICDGGPSTARGIIRPARLGEIHAVCLAALRGAAYRSLETKS